MPGHMRVLVCRAISSGDAGRRKVLRALLWSGTGGTREGKVGFAVTLTSAVWRKKGYDREADIALRGPFLINV